MGSAYFYASIFSLDLHRKIDFNATLQKSPLTPLCMHSLQTMKQPLLFWIVKQLAFLFSHPNYLVTKFHISVIPYAVEL